MIFGATATIAERLLARLLENDSYRDSILGDLYEGAEERAYESELEASRWYRQQVLRSVAALLPSAAVRERNAVAGAAVGVTLYAMCVKVSSLVAVAVSERLPSPSVAARWAAYLLVIVAAGVLAGFILGRVRRLPISSALLFFVFALGAGAHHVVDSQSAEIAFRSTKVLLFIVASGVGMRWGMSWFRLPRRWPSSRSNPP